MNQDAKTYLNKWNKYQKMIQEILVFSQEFKYAEKLMSIILKQYLGFVKYKIIYYIYTP